ncbi:hypothetical protein RR46_05866 [Papilio xuthus]|uniref:Uncharacterized protein n=1 Tax=Papilio xuthus TaxID=66420 RepID=A0A194PPF4_PAPXU|nr:hypothetical protein RR46_05866 [Papilio xuthus]
MCVITYAARRGAMDYNIGDRSLRHRAERRRNIGSDTAVCECGSCRSGTTAGTGAGAVRVRVTVAAGSDGWRRLADSETSRAARRTARAALARGPSCPAAALAR